MLIRIIQLLFSTNIVKLLTLNDRSVYLSYHPYQLPLLLHLSSVDLSI